MRYRPGSQPYPTRQCPLCGWRKSRRIFRQMFTSFSERGLLEGYDVVVCGRCGFGFADHIPAPERFDAYYSEMSKYEGPREGTKVAPEDLSRFYAIAEELRPLIGKRDQILEIGCSSAHLLACLREAGFPNVVGVDPSARCAAEAQRRHGITVLTGSLASLYEDLRRRGPFGVILMIGVLEHIPDLDQVLRSIHELTAGGGRICVEVPDSTRFARWIDAPYQQFSVEHINYFSPSSLRRLLALKGFRDVRTRILTRAHTAKSMMPVINSVSEHIAVGSHAGQRDQSDPTERALTLYVRRSAEFEKSIHRQIDRLAQLKTPVVIWGTGTLTQRLLATGGLSQVRIAAFVDSNPHYQGKTLQGVPILSPDALRMSEEPILIASLTFQDEIEYQLRSEFRLTNPVWKLGEESLGAGQEGCDGVH